MHAAFNGWGCLGMLRAGMCMRTLCQTISQLAKLQKTRGRIHATDVVDISHDVPIGFEAPNKQKGCARSCLGLVLNTNALTHNEGNKVPVLLRGRSERGNEALDAAGPCRS